MSESLQSRYESVCARVEQSAKAAGRSIEEITLIVVTKNHPAQLVLDLLEFGARDFGENRDQEASSKAEAVAESLAASGSPPDYRWHFVGQLQSNKVRSVLRYAQAVHSLDRTSLLQALEKELAKEPERSQLDVFIELNLTDDPQRGGLDPKSLEEFTEAVLRVPQLKLRGVMGVATLDRQAERDFEFIRACSDRVRALSPGANQISAGMSGDFETAISFGATHLRIGTAITGERQY